MAWIRLGDKEMMFALSGRQVHRLEDTNAEDYSTVNETAILVFIETKRYISAAAGSVGR